MQLRFTLPEYVQKVSRILKKEGFQSYLVGGAIRDIMIGIDPYDYDLATDATPDQMITIFPKSVATGARFGMVTSLVQDSKGETHEVEVTTFRSEEKYIDGRWPSQVEFIKDIDKDLGRRDFTINAMAIDLSQHDLQGDEIELAWDVHDPFDGQGDVDRHLVRAVGTPLERFKEDGLRAYKACRIASQFEFQIEPDTMSAIQQALPVARLVSMERVRDEFMKMILKSPKPSYGIELMRESGLLELFMPEMLEGYGVIQRKFHADDVYWHSLKCCDIANDDIKLAALLHDIGKPRKDMGDGHFYGHDSEGAKMAAEIMSRMKFPKAEIKRTVALIQNHMFYYPVEGQDGQVHDQKNPGSLVWSDTAVRRFIARVGEDNIDDLFQLRIADATSNPMSSFDREEIDVLERRIAKVREDDMALSVADLQISGSDLMELGIPKGPDLGRVLNGLLEYVLDDPLVNTKEILSDIALKVYKNEDAPVAPAGDAYASMIEDSKRLLAQEMKSPEDLQGLIKALLNLLADRHEGIAGKSDESLVEVWSRDIYESVVELFLRVVATAGERSIELVAWPGIPGAGKGTNAQIIEDSINFVQGLPGAELPQSVVDDLLPPYVIKTGSGGILRPDSGYYADLFETLGHLLKREMESGRLLGDYTVTIWVYLLIAEKLLTGEREKINILLDLWPRSEGQMVMLKKLESQCKEHGVDIQLSFIIFSLVPPRFLDSINGNLQEYRKSVDMVAAFFAEINDTGIESIAQLKSKLVERFGMEDKHSITFGLHEELLEAMTRVELRGRDDDKVESIIRRMKAFYGETLPPFIVDGVEVVSTNQLPGDMVASVVKRLLANHDLSDPAIELLVNRCRLVAERYVRGLSEAKS